MPPRTLRLDLSYDGSDFFGWQVQPHARTVQGEIENALGVILGRPVRIAGAGRTDRGVHALHQVASFTTDHTIPVEGLRRGLNSLLPADVRIEAVREAPHGFHARYTATSRRYSYHLVREPDIFRERYGWLVPHAPSNFILAESVQPLIGRHRFDSFTCGEGLEGDTGCHVLSITLKEDQERITLSIEADRFLYRMVRTIVGTLIHLNSRGELSSRAVALILEERRHGAWTVAAPPQGLFLTRVSYPPDDLP